MTYGSTLFLKGVITLIGSAALVLCIVIFRAAIQPEAAGDYRPILLSMCVSAIPFFIALYQTIQLLRFIDKNSAFSHASVRALQVIKYAAISISALYTLGMPYIFIVADRDDAPGVILIGLVIILASFAVAVFAAVLQSLLHHAIDIKTENELTV